MHRVLHGIALICLLWTTAAGDTGTADMLVLSSPGFPALMMMGPAGRPLAAGPESGFGNPALILPGFTAAGGRWNLQTTAVSIAGGFSASTDLKLGVGLTYLGRGGILRRDETGAVTGEYSYSTGSFFAGASHRINPWLTAGASAGIGWENIDSGSGTGIIASAGLAAELGEAGAAGVSVTGLGTAPTWNGVSKAMPVEISAGARWRLNSLLACFAGSGLGLSTASSHGGGLMITIPRLLISAGYRLVPGEEELTGFFGGVQYTYESGGTYILEAAVSQRDQLEWPVLAGISVRL